MRLFATTALAALLPLAASAQEVIGTINATIDGTEHNWFVTEQDGETQSLLVKVMRDFHAVTLWGNPSAENNAQFQGALILDFSVLTRGGSIQTMEPGLQWLEQGYRSGYLATEEGTTSVTLTKAEETDTGLSVEGSFQSTAEFSDQMMRQITDPSRTVEIEGTFEATLPLQ